jgi:hypothetical protein
MSYAFCDADALPVQHYCAAPKLSPITGGNRAFVEWCATFDCTPERHDEWTAFYRDAFGRCRLAAAAFGRSALDLAVGVSLRRQSVCDMIRARGFEE